MQTQIAQIYPLNEPKAFTEEEAYRVLNLMYHVTQKSKDKINSFKSQMEYHKNTPATAHAYEKELNQAIMTWSNKMKRLGGTPVSLFQVKIPSEEGGFFFWEYPSAELEFHH